MLTQNTRGASLDLSEAGINDLQKAMQSGESSAVALTQYYLKRIASLDKQGPAVNAIIELNPDALEIAHQRDAERKQNRVRGPLHGIPVLVKDNIDTADRMTTTAGSLALEGSIAAKDSFIVSRLREAGAVLLGKTNLSEWANFRSTHSSSGWSGRGGQTRNPYVLDRNPCGSSSGSGAAVAAGFCSVAVGTETDGSIVCPSSLCGIVGIKPTLGMVSRSGIIPIAHSQDTAGPMARTVRDAALLLNVLAGTDAEDQATNAWQAHQQSDYTQFLDAGGLRGARIGVARKYFGLNADVDRLMEESLRALKKAGAILVDPADLPTHGKWGDSEYDVLLYEFKTDLNAYLSKLGPKAKVHSLEELIRFNQANRGREMPWFEQEILVEAQKKGSLTAPDYLDALRRNHELTRDKGIDQVLRSHQLDAIIAPTAGPAWLTDWVTGDHDAGSCSSAAAVAGYPHITVPAGQVHGLPVGLSFFGTAWSEPTLLKLAYAFEQATHARKAPAFLPSLGHAKTNAKGTPAKSSSSN